MLVEETAATELAELFRTLGDSGRILILSALTAGEKNVQTLAEAARISESAASHHLRHLRQLRLVRKRKAGRYVYYALDDDHIAQIFQSALEHIEHR